MSAITGIFYRNGGKSDPELIKKMNDKLSHRGPDGSAVWNDISIAFGHQMLLTTPESLHEELPFEDKESGLVITADARIDNRNELSRELDIKDEENVSDSYFIIKAYEKWNEKCPDYLMGDFAFAIWDKNEEILFCARDHMGVKPFYYYLSEDLFVFATEIKAILSIPDIPRRINEARIAQYLITIHKDQEITFYDGIQRLPAACSIKINQKDHILQKYWALDPNFELKLNSDEEYINQFREIFRESIKNQMRSAFPLGSLLSGGLDSSSIVCIAGQFLKKNNKGPLKTFSAIFEVDLLCGEQEYINAVVNVGNIEPYYVRVDKIGPLSYYEETIKYTDEAVWFPNLFMAWCMHNKAKEKGVRVMLEGSGGDGVLSLGKGYLNDLLKKGRIIKFIKELNAFSRIRNLSPYRLFIKTLIDTIASNRFNKVWKYRKEKTFNPNDRKRIIKDSFTQKIYQNDDIQSVMRKYSQKSNDPKDMHLYSLTSGLLQYWLEVSDKISGAAGIESRYPFLNKNLIEFCFSLPTEQKISDGWDRIILRTVMNNVLPPEIQWRRHKADMSQNFNRNFLLFDHELIEDVIYKDHNILENYVDIDVLRESYEKYKKKGAKNNRAIRNVWRAVTLGLWLRSQN